MEGIPKTKPDLVLSPKMYNRSITQNKIKKLRRLSSNESYAQLTTAGTTTMYVQQQCRIRD
jgi:hypothetical protein